MKTNKYISFALILFFIIFWLIGDPKADYFSFIYLLIPFSYLFFRKHQINEIQLELKSDEIINSEIKQFFAAWALWRTNKRLVLCFPVVAKKGIGKYLAKGVNYDKHTSENEKDPLGYFLKNSKNYDSQFNTKTGFLNINLKSIKGIEKRQEKWGGIKVDVFNITLKESSSEFSIFFGKWFGGQKAGKVLEKIKLEL